MVNVRHTLWWCRYKETCISCKAHFRKTRRTLPSTLSLARLRFRASDMYFFCNFQEILSAPNLGPGYSAQPPSAKKLVSKRWLHLQKMLCILWELGETREKEIQYVMIKVRMLYHWAIGERTSNYITTGSVDSCKELENLCNNFILES